MKQLRTLLMRAFVAALLFIALSSSVASADPGVPGGGASGLLADARQASIPEDPGIEYLPPDLIPEDPGIN
jgi:hypothetical protein